MKLRFLAIVFAAVFVIGLSACGDNAVESVLDIGTGSDVEEEEYDIEVPEAIINLSEEEDILLRGELKDGVYTNNYFGYRCTAPAGSTLYCFIGDSGEIPDISMKEAYEDGWGGIPIAADLDIGSTFDVNITGLEENEAGLNEEELVKKKIQDRKDIDALFGEDEDDGPELETLMLMGEEHPASVSRTDTDEGVKLSCNFYIPKGDFAYSITLFGTEEQIEEYIKCFEKI